MFAFISVTKERTEVIFQGTRNLTIIPDEHGGIWEEYQFKCKPGDPRRRPCLISPYHYRLDWLMWFAAFQVRLRSSLICRTYIKAKKKDTNTPNCEKRRLYSEVVVSLNKESLESTRQAYELREAQPRATLAS